MARKPKADVKAPSKAKAKKAAAAPEASAPAASAHKAVLELAAAHGAQLSEAPEETGSGVRAKCHAPHSIERFVAAARAHPQVRDVRVLPAHVELDVEGAPE